MPDLLRVLPRKVFTSSLDVILMSVPRSLVPICTELAFAIRDVG